MATRLFIQNNTPGDLVIKVVDVTYNDPNLLYDPYYLQKLSIDDPVNPVGDLCIPAGDTQIFQLVDRHYILFVTVCDLEPLPTDVYELLLDNGTMEVEPIDVATSSVEPLSNVGKVRIDGCCATLGLLVSLLPYVDLVDPYVGAYVGPDAPCADPYVDPYVGPDVTPCADPYIGSDVAPCADPYDEPYEDADDYLP